MSNISRDDIIKLIILERDKQLNSPNSSEDELKTKNDWTSKIGYYLFETSSKQDKHVTFEEFRESLIKAAAIILSALENSYEHASKNSAEMLLLKINQDSTDD